MAGASPPARWRAAAPHVANASAARNPPGRDAAARDLVAQTAPQTATSNGGVAAENARGAKTAPRPPPAAGNALQLKHLQPLVNDPRDPNPRNADDVAKRETALRHRLQELDRAEVSGPGQAGPVKAGGAPPPAPEPPADRKAAAPPSGAASARQPQAPPAVHANRGDQPMKTIVVRGRGASSQGEAPSEAALVAQQQRAQDDAAADANEDQAQAKAGSAAPADGAGAESVALAAPAGGATRRTGGGRGSGDGGAGADPRVVVQRWRGGVTAAGTGMPRRNMGAVAGGPAQVKGAADQGNQQRDAQRKGLPDEATQNIAAPPQVEKPPAPPQSNPIPDQTGAVEAASDKTLPAQALPVFVQTPVRHVASGVLVGGNWPQLGQRPVPNDVFQMILNPGADKLAQIPDDPANAERKRIDDARAVLEEPIVPGEQMADGANPPLVDTGPKPPKPLPEGLKTPVASVVARLLADIDGAASDVVKRMRILAYPRGVLNEKYPDIGAPLKDVVGPRMGTDLREIAGAAGASAEEIDTLVADRKAELEVEANKTQDEVQKTGDEAKESVDASGQQTLDAIAGTRQAVDEQIVDKQEQASGGNDPAVINARRDLIIAWVRNRVTTQTTHYQKAGEKRETELGRGQLQRINAYNALAQREEYQGLNPRPPWVHDRTKAEIVRQLADFAAATRVWTRDQVEAVKAAIGPLITAARTATKDNRNSVETAGNDAIKAARTWAQDRILEGQSWWERFKATLERWFGDSQEANEVWCVRRTEETRDAIATDLVTINGIQAAVTRGATQEELLQTEGLSADQRAIIVEFFQLPAGTHPLDFAALLLRRRLAGQYLDLGRAAFEQELLAKPDDQADTLNDIQRSVRPSFDAGKIAETVHAQLDNFNSDEAAILASLEGLSAFEGAIVRKLYRMRFRIDMDFAMAQALDSDEQDQARLRLKGEGAAADAAALDYAFGVINTDEKAIMDLLRGRSLEQIEAIKAEYRRRYGKELDVALDDNLDEGNEQDQAKALMKGDKETADAIAIDEAMRGGLFGWGTDNEEIEATYKRVHDEVLALAQREGWNSEQMKAELRRRTQLIEKKFGEKYADVEAYQDPAHPGKTVLQNAISDEMDPGPERDLANALRTDDPIAADAARIEIERQGLWASDEKINNVLTNQYERALQDTRLDQGPARQARVNRLRRELSRHDPPLDEEEISKRVIKLEREMEGEMSAEAQQRSKLSMDLLDQAYSDKYTYPLWYTIEANMSGVDRQKARSLHKQGGHLTALQAVEYATDQTGTDEEALKSRLGNMTKAQIDQLRIDWEKRHPGESFDDMLRGELSGRDESDIMDMVAHGAPESASQRIAQERRRTQRELDDLTGVLGGAAAGNEERWLRLQQKKLDDLEPQLFRTDLSEEEREVLRDELDFRVERVQAAVEDHRRAIDSVANLAAQVASMVVAVTVGAILTAVSGGALGPVMIAVIASVAATLTTMGTKALIMGGSYGAEDIGVDLAVGVVDALTSAATAGMGGRILKGAAGVGQRAAQPTRVTRLLGGIGRSGIGQKVAQSRAGQVIGRAASRFNQMESGFLTQGIRGNNILARMAAGDNKALRFLAEALAEGIENAASALPSAFVGTALDDNTWKGNPLANLIVGTATGVGTSVAIGGAMHVGGAAVGHVRNQFRLASPEGRLREANRILGDAFQQHRVDHPDASYSDFLHSPAGQRARADVDAAGLVSGADLAKLAVATEPDLHAKTEAPSQAVDDLAARAQAQAEPDAARAQADTPPHTVPEAPQARAPDASAEPRATVEAEPAKAQATDPATQKLREGLPDRLTSSVEVKVNADLDGNTVRVIPDEHGGARQGVRVEVGPDATPTDVLLHAHTVQSMQRYQGLLGRLRQFADWFRLTTVGSRGWEAKLELEKLPGIIHERMQQLSKGSLSLDAQMKLMDEINGLSRQIDEHRRILESPDLRDGPGRGFVAAERLQDPAEIAGLPTRDVGAPKRTTESQKQYPHSIASGSTLKGKVYQLGGTWTEKGRSYRRVFTVDEHGNTSRVREEIQSIDAAGHGQDHWVQRGSESSGRQGLGAIGERASDITVREGRFEDTVDRRGRRNAALRESAAGKERFSINENNLRNDSNNGFDGVFLRKNKNDSYSVVLVEAKHQKSGLGLDSFSAITGERLETNVQNLIKKLESEPCPIKELTPAQRELMVDILKGNSGSVEVQVHTTPETPLGGRTRAGDASILQKLENEANARLGLPSSVRVVHVKMSEAVTARAVQDVAARDAIGKMSGRVTVLAGKGATEGTLAYDQARSMLLAEGVFTDGLVTRTGDGVFVDSKGTQFEVLMPGSDGIRRLPKTVVSDIVSRVGSAAPVGAVAPRKVILDLSNLDVKRQKQVIDELKKIKPPELLGHVIIHDRENGTMNVFDPKDYP